LLSRWTTKTELAGAAIIVSDAYLGIGMIGQALSTGISRDTAGALIALVRAEGSAAHCHPISEVLTNGPEAARNVADIVHLLCLLHGRHPGVVDHAIDRITNDAARAFLTDAADAFARERALLTKLVVAVGPLPSTPGQADTETAVLAQHHAIDMLAQSERSGCAFGAALALLADWAAIRPVLETAARRLSLDIEKSALPNAAMISSIICAAANSEAADRAMLFGAQQIVAQHRGLWDLLEARAIARSDY
jgi:hypothetical protein